MAIALDVSNSIEDLLKAARLELWDVVGDLSVLEPMPLLRVALLTNGYGSCNRADDCAVIQTDFSQDIDRLSGQRRQHVEAAMQARGIDPTTTFQATVLGAIRELAEERGFEAPEEN